MIGYLFFKYKLNLEKNIRPTLLYYEGIGRTTNTSSRYLQQAYSFPFLSHGWCEYVPRTRD
jgi:hypothetical protein